MSVSFYFSHQVISINQIYHHRKHTRKNRKADKGSVAPEPDHQVPVVVPKPRATKKHRIYGKAPTPADGFSVIESISVITSTIFSVVKDRRFLTEFEETLRHVNKSRKKVSLFQKHHCLRILEKPEEEREELPALDNVYFSHLFTALRGKAKWKYGAEYDDLLELHHIAPPDFNVSPAAMTQIMGENAIRCAAELKTHIQTHYTKFYKRWLKWRLKMSPDGPDGFDKDNTRQNPNNLDPKTTDINILIKCLYKMSQSLENANVRGFNIFPEARIDANYITFSPTTIIAMFVYLKRKLHGINGKINKRDKPTLIANDLGWLLKPGKHGPVFKSPTELRVIHGKRIFRDIFLMKLIRKKRKTHHFRFSFQTNGKGIQLSFGKWIQVPNKDIREGPPTEFDDGTEEPKRAKVMPVENMIPGLEYSYQGKHLISFDKLSGWTIRYVKWKSEKYLCCCR